jgi:hypothetical protein
MSNSEMVRELREVGRFDRLLMKDHGELLIVVGNQPSLTVETSRSLQRRIKSEVIDGRLTLGFGSWLDKLGEAFTTSLTRTRIRYELTVAELTDIEVCGLARVQVNSLVTEALRIKLCGPVDANVSSLTVEKLEVEMLSGGKLVTSGQAAAQAISVGGPGFYDGTRLRSERARVQLSGPGRASVWVTDELDVVIRGIGEVTYFGSPAIRKNIMGIGLLTHRSHVLGVKQ